MSNIEYEKDIHIVTVLLRVICSVTAVIFVDEGCSCDSGF